MAVKKKAKRKVAKKVTKKRAKAAGTGVWSGSIARLRVYDQPNSTGKRVFAYVSPGTNSNYIGNSNDPNVVEALFRARDNGRSVTGYTGSDYKIQWMDY